MRFNMLAKAVRLTLLASVTGLTALHAAANTDIKFSADQIYPEGVAWSAKQNVFFVSSIRHGIVGKVSKQGKYTPFITDEKLVSSVGIVVDAKRNILWVANSDPGTSSRSTPATQGKLAAVAAYDVTSGERRAYYDLSGLVEGSHFANDLTLDTDGNVYVTDSFSPVIYRIDTAGKATVFARSDMFIGGEGFNLNGIAYHPDGFLLAGMHNSGELFRVSMKDPEQVQRVKMPEALKGADGLVLRESGRLTVVQNNGADRTIDLVSSDGWKTARIQRKKKSVLSFPTTATKLGKNLYVLNARLDTLFDKDAPKVSDFLLQKY